ncbi:uncharacterized protein LOC110264862 [Arachis ipaensis]|uniref:uncharacterized protein LOC110264862 n=1 Tax=Arachis ipaensis TaxID=130454 RepID=UPI000A2B64B7|nr:uncharacterized protein LOC110264862 [Arachis ipaensis]
MVDIYAVLVFYHGGHFGRGPSGTLEYIGGKVEKFSEMDLDFVNFGDLVTLFKGLGYATYRVVYWYDPTSNDLESGLHILRGDAGINEMRENKLRNSNINEFYIYFDHPVDEPQIVEEEAAAEQGPEEFDEAVDVDSIMRELQSSPSTAGDGNGSGEDELYEPTPNGTETGSDDDSSSCDEENDLMKKRSTVKGKEKVMPRRRVTVKEGPGTESSGNKRGAGRKTAGVPSGKGTMPAAKPKGSVPHHKPQKTGAAVHAEEDVPSVQPNDRPPIGLYVNEEESDDDDPIYEYASEDLHTPVNPQRMRETNMNFQCLMKTMDLERGDLRWIPSLQP